MTEQPCPNCAEPLIVGKPYCPSCGAKVPADEAIETLKSYLDAQLAKRISDQAGLVREVADKSEDIVIKRFRNYAILIGSFISLGVVAIGYFGYSKYEGLYRDIEPRIAGIRTRLDVFGKDLDNANTRIQSVKQTLDTVSADVDHEAHDIAERTAELTRRYNDMDAASSSAETVAKATDERLNAISSRLDAEAKRLDQRASQIATQIDNVGIQEAYPSLGQREILNYVNKPWTGSADKKPGEVWVNVSVAYLALKDYTPEQLKRIEDAVRNSNAIPFVGSFTLAGPVLYPDSHVYAHGATTVYYLTDDQKPLATILSISAHDILQTPVAVEKFGSGFVQQPFDDAMAASGIDIQIFIQPKS